jgi:hypothetical protein
VSRTQSFADSCLTALDFIDELRGRKIHGYLHSKLIEGEYNSRGIMQCGLYEWVVNWSESK